MIKQAADIEKNIADVRARIRSACQRAGRSEEDVTLVAISKTMPEAYVLKALAAGLRDFGENRIEEARPKVSAVRKHTAEVHRWHMVGHVQSRKARDVINMNFDLIHSLDALKLAQRYNRFTIEQNQVVSVLLEVNMSGEMSKSGWDVYGWELRPQCRTQLWLDIEAMLALPGLKIKGLMTMAPMVENQEQARPFFAGLVRLREALQCDFPRLSLEHLSMGMSDDFEAAIEEGATLVRIGRAIFGERPSA